MRSWLAVGAVWLVACSVSTSEPPPQPVAPAGCVNGSTATCACEDGRAGAQKCGPDGEYGPCVCPQIVDSGAQAADAAPDAGDVDACVPPPVSIDPAVDDCEIIEECDACAGGWLYRCNPVGVTGQPKLHSKQPAPGCRFMGNADDAGAVRDYCCPPACVRSMGWDATCVTGYTKAYVCPTADGSTSLTGKPANQCISVAVPPGARLRYCCQ